MAKASRSGKNLTAQTTARLRQAGLRPTRQRVELAGLLFGDCDRHVTAESLHDEIAKSGVKVSLATVYNTLHQFTQAGLLRQVIVDAARSYFDTNTGDHQHFFLEKEGMLIDIPPSRWRVFPLRRPVWRWTASMWWSGSGAPKTLPYQLSASHSHSLELF